MNIFVSSTTQGLESYRGLAREIIGAQGHDVVVQEHFSTPQKQIIDEIRDRIYHAAGIVALVGPYYGTESPVARNGILLSYTQYELLYGIKCRKPCLVLLTKPNFQAEPIAGGRVPEQSEEHARRQKEFITMIKAHQDCGWTEFSGKFEFALALAKHRWKEWLDGR